MSEFLEPFVELGRKVEEAFARVQFAEAAFADIAVAHVEKARLHEHFDLEKLARWVMAGTDLPPQKDVAGNFGEPPVTLWNGRRCFVSALVWGTGSVAIHQHCFTGAFQVLQGASVHARFSFTPAVEVSEDLAVGDLTCTAIECLTKGTTRSIPGGAAGVHSLFHLDYPSVSLVVRTHADSRYPIQFVYFPPGLAIWDKRGEPQLMRARQFARTLIRLDTRQAKAVISDALPILPAYDIFWLLLDVLRSGSLDLSLRLLDGCRARLPAGVADAFAAALGEESRRAVLYRRRTQIVEPSLRFFLAILLNASTRSDVLTLVGAYVPDESPVDTLVGWITNLQDVKLSLQAGGGVWEPNAFGLPEADDPSLAALRAALSGDPPSSTDGLPFYEAVRRNRALAPLFRN